jgi:hypothetical protein
MKKILFILALFAAPLWSAAQYVIAYRSVSELNKPELTWFSLDKSLKPEFEVFRAPVGSTAFVTVPTLRRNSSGGDTLFFHVIDTTLTVKGLYQYFIKVRKDNDSLALSEVMYGHNMGALPSPQVISFTAKSATDRKALILDWKLNYGFTVKVLALFRSRHYDRGFELVALIPADTTHYVDIVQVSNEPYFYFFQIRDFFGYQIPSVVVHGICTYAEKPYPPQNLKSETVRDHVELSWKSVGKNITGYRVYKSYSDPGIFMQAGPTIPVADTTVVFADTAVHNAGKLSARYYVVTLSDGNLESNHTDTLTVDLPWNLVISPPDEVDYTIDSTGAVRLFWTAADPLSGVDRYNVYRSADGITFTKISTDSLGPADNTFADPAPARGRIWYSVESVSVAGKASPLRTMITVERPLTAFHLVVSAEQNGANIDLTWADTGIPGLDAFYVYRKTGEGNAELMAMVKPGSGSWSDTGVAAGNDYLYTVVAEFTDGKRIIVNDGVLVVVR